MNEVEPATVPTTAPAPHPITIRLQILSTEHWSLIAARGLAWNEAFSRAGMFLSTLSGALVALGLIGGIDHFGATFVDAALAVLPVVLFVGLGTFLRMGAVNYHDAMAIVGMNRIRAAYVEIAPDLAPYFVMGVHDDPAGVARTMAVPPRMPVAAHVLSATPAQVQVLNGVVAGAIAAVMAAGLARLPAIPTLGWAALGFALTVGIQLRIVASSMRSGRQGIRPMFPTPGA